MKVFRTVVTSHDRRSGNASRHGEGACGETGACATALRTLGAYEKVCRRAHRARPPRVPRRLAHHRLHHRATHPRCDRHRTRALRPHRNRLPHPHPTTRRDRRRGHLRGAVAGQLAAVLHRYPRPRAPLRAGARPATSRAAVSGGVANHRLPAAGAARRSETRRIWWVFVSLSTTPSAVRT